MDGKNFLMKILPKRVRFREELFFKRILPKKECFMTGRKF